MNYNFDVNVSDNVFKSDITNLISLVTSRFSFPINNLFISSLKPNLEQMDEDSGILGPTSDAPGTDWDYSFYNPMVNVDNDYILAINSDLIQDGVDLPSFGIYNHLSPVRVVFHELMHSQFDWHSRSASYINFEEELCIFAENTMYVRAASDLGQNDGNVIRYGHATNASFNGNGVSGISSFLIYSDVSLGFKNETEASFTASNSLYSIKKTYYNFDHTVDGINYDHYIRLEETVDSLYSYMTKFGYSYDNRVSILAADMMGSSFINSSLSIAGEGVKSALYSMDSSNYIGFKRVLGLGNDAYADAKDNVLFYYVGASAAGSTNNPTSYNINDETSIIDTLIIGAGHGVGVDKIKAGGGNDMIIGTGTSAIIHGGNGNDTILGTSGNDSIYGEVGSDIIIGSSGSDIIDGGVGAYEDVLTYAGSSASISFDCSQMFGNSGDAIGDTISNIERIIGTNFNDLFLGTGGMVIDGNNGTDTLSFELFNSSVNIDLVNGTSSDGGSFKNIETIVGSVFDDTFIGIIGIIIEGGDGDDVFDLERGGIAHGQDGNDTFIVSGSYAYLPTIYGGSGYDKLDVSSGAFSSYNMATGQFFNYDGSMSIVQGIEEVTFRWGTVYGSENSDTIINTMMGVAFGRGGDDYMTGNSEGNHGGIEGLFGDGGNDYLVSLGYDNLYGGADNDTLVGSSNTRLLDGGNGDDIFYGNPDSNSITVIVTGYGNDIVYGNGSNRMDIQYNFTMNYDPSPPLYGDDGSLISIFDRGDYFEVTTTQGVDKIYGAYRLMFESSDPNYAWEGMNLYEGMSWVNPNGPPDPQQNTSLLMSSDDIAIMNMDQFNDYGSDIDMVIDHNYWKTALLHELDYHIM